MNRNVELSEREEVVMGILWKYAETGNYASCKDVIYKLKIDFDSDYAETTVYTFLKNLIKKGYVEDRKDKGFKIYIPVKSKEDYVKKVLKRTNKVFFDGNKKDFINTIKSIDM